MINTKSMMMLIDDMIRRYKHVYAPIVTVVIRAASLYGVIVVFAYLFQIHYAPSTLAGVIILAPYIFFVGLIVVLYVYFIASAPGIFVKYLMTPRDLRQADGWVLPFGISIVTVMFVVLLWVGNDGSLSRIIINLAVTVITLVISWVGYKIAGRHFNEKKLLSLIKVTYLIMILAVIMPGYPRFLIDLTGIAKPEAYIYSSQTMGFNKVDIRFIGAEHLVVSPYLPNGKVSGDYVILQRGDVTIFSTVPTDQQMSTFKSLVVKK
ncbi:hypothetical protein ACJU26_03960 [Acidithiobacillus sp. M4-SHS-6]|uniref:hypothetical protein n=1 Tax=Acidithiobacillus sp. M4-SHS-6 TaxID=3383024 RepID=UPI0039BDCFB9